MTARLFELGNLGVMPFWLLMVFAPRWRWTETVMRSWWVALVPAVFYAVLVVPELPTLLPLLARPTLEGVAPLLGSTTGATIAWLHFLAFDLFVGRVVFLDAKERGMPWFISSPILGAVLMVGPLGFLLHVVARRGFSTSSPRSL